MRGYVRLWKHCCQLKDKGVRDKFSTGGAVVLSGLIVLPVTLWVVITQPLWGDPVIMTPPTIDPSRLEKHVRMLAEVFYPRDEAHTENLNRTANYIRNEFQQAKGEVLDQCYDVRQKTYCNVIARFGPDTKERIVVGAHYDAFGELPGADDNASGVAGLIELAYLLGKASLPIKRIKGQSFNF